MLFSLRNPFHDVPDDPPGPDDDVVFVDDNSNGNGTVVDDGNISDFGRTGNNNGVTNGLVKSIFLGCVLPNATD
ncbi:hypothetical protein DERP_009025 [Dermatophagoides pteronyssinus]|uniref:Uncharacterized protein n=1 Tax=Dermatophagoides pteronyssinus TaxID=6956 RepID=A0ABQ8JGQ1_DERPT|nr:hypothetical protein DERP_009025 [Dermatophagoides pteronyssinus]